MFNLVLLVYIFVFFFKQKTAYEMRISDWSSDVCSSDLPRHRVEHLGREPRAHLAAVDEGVGEIGGDDSRVAADPGRIELHHPGTRKKIGRASCRERVCQYV